MLSRRASLVAVAIGLVAVAGAAHAQSPLGIGSAEPSFSAQIYAGIVEFATGR